MGSCKELEEARNTLLAEHQAVVKLVLSRLEHMCRLLAGAGADCIQRGGTAAGHGYMTMHGQCTSCMCSCKVLQEAHNTLLTDDQAVVCAV